MRRPRPAGGRRLRPARLSAPSARKARRARAAKAVAVAVSAVLALGTVPSALAGIDLPDSIQRFERLNPVESLVLEAGASQDELSLPSTLRALVPLASGADASAFEQAAPAADTSDGYETYDYYSFGYIAPKDAAALYESGGRVVYSIAYAGRDAFGNPTGEVGEVAYRVYGTVGGGEAAWYACDEAGVPDARIVDVPVSWDTSGVDLSAPGDYTATASFSGWLYLGAAPTASVKVEEGKSCTCGAGGDAGGAAHAQDCPLHEEAQESSGSDGVEVVDSAGSADVDAAVERAEASAADEPAGGEEACTCGAGGDALRHEAGCALYAEPCGQECHCAADGGPIDAANFPWAHDEACPCYSPVECMCREEVEVQTEQESCDGAGASATTQTTTTETVPGAYSHVHDPDNIDCPLHGRDVVEVSKAETAESAQAASGGADGAASDDAGAGALSDAAASSTAMADRAAGGEWGAPETTWMALEDAGAALSAQEEGARLHQACGEISLTGKALSADGAEMRAELSSGAGAGATPLSAGAANAAAATVSVSLLPEGGLFSGAAKAFGSLLGSHEARAAGTRDTVVNKYIQDHTPTSGNADLEVRHLGAEYFTCPGSWVDYVHTVFMNKGFARFSWQADASCAARGNWKWGGTTASQTSGTVTTNASRIPAKSGTTWTVYSGEQLRYAFSNCASGDTVKLGSNLNLNGANYDWTAPTVSGGKSVVFDGAGKTVYNYGMFGTRDVGSSFTSLTLSFLTCTGSLTVKNLALRNSRSAADFYGTAAGSARVYLGITCFGRPLSGCKLLATNVSLADSLWWARDRSRFPDISFLNSSGFTAIFQGGAAGSQVSGCSMRGVSIYGSSHVGTMWTNAPAAADQTWCRNSYVVDTLMCTVGIHSSGFIPCNGGTNLDVRECFTSVEMYVGAIASAFAGLFINCTDCFATGKLEGYDRIAGFRFGDNTNTVDARCYSTALVGTRSNPQRQGGFNCEDILDAGSGGIRRRTFTDCYAAGEVGNFDVDMEKNTRECGGFTAETDNYAALTISNCYYDKQMTAMREWASGDTKSVAGVTGVLTSSTDKAGTGLASGTYGGSGDAGFRGFSDNSKWVYAAGRYPQLAAFANATSSAWGSADAANMVKAYSLASTATVALDAWDSGYTWDADGVRSAAESSWTGDGGDHAGGKYTYDTVREMVSDAGLTSGATFSHQVAGGMKSQVTDVDADPATTSLEGPAVVVDASTGKTSPNVPGVEWGTISCSSGGQTASRPIRLAALMRVEAGSDAQVDDGQVYDSREGVKLTAMDTNVDDLVVGIDDAKAWAKAKRSGYPDKSADPAYYKVSAPAISGTQASTSGLLLYSDVRRLRQGADGGLVTDSSGSYIEDDIIVDLRAGEGGASARAMWAGQAAMRAGVSFGRSYKVTYYLLAADGRYRSDSKVVTVNPTSYAASVRAWDSSGASALASALHLGAAADAVSGTESTPDRSVSDSTVATASAANIPYGRNATLSWRRDDERWHVNGAKLTFSDKAGNSYSAAVDGDLAAGSTVSVSGVPYVSASHAEIAGRGDGLCRETWASASVTLSYTVQEDAATGALYLRLNKLANAPSFAEGEVGYPGEAASALLGGDATGISATDAYVNDMQYDVTLDLYVVEDVPFSFTKTASDHATALAGATFSVYECGNAAHVKAADHSATVTGDAGCCWKASTTHAALTSGDDGLVDFGRFQTGQYMLVETAAPAGYELPHGQWMLDVDAAAQTVSITARGQDGDLPPAFKKDAATGAYSVANYRKWTMPLAGGTGPIALTALGTALVAAALARLLLARRKRTAS